MRDWIDAFRVLHLGWAVAFALLIPTLAGLYVDKRFGTAPLALVGGALLGIVVATYGMTRVILERYRAIEARRQPDRDAE
jgi:F0F1-type ATP synthase assembly protein I